MIEKKDGRKLSIKVQQELRYLAIDFFEQGNPQVKIAQTLSVSLSAITKWIRIYKLKGVEGLVLNKRGIKLGTNCRLDIRQTEKFKVILTSNTPDQVGLRFSLWTRHAVQLLINKL